MLRYALQQVDIASAFTKTNAVLHYRFIWSWLFPNYCYRTCKLNRALPISSWELADATCLRVLCAGFCRRHIQCRVCRSRRQFATASIVFGKCAVTRPHAAAGGRAEEADCCVIVLKPCSAMAVLRFKTKFFPFSLKRCYGPACNDMHFAAAMVLNFILIWKDSLQVL